MEGGDTAVQFGTNLHLSLISRKKAENIPDSSLTFFCYITVVEEMIAPIDKSVLLHNMATDFEKELYNSKSSDVTLEVRKSYFYKHIMLKLPDICYLYKTVVILRLKMNQYLHIRLF